MPESNLPMWAQEALERAEVATPAPWWNESGVIHAPAWWPDAQPGAACHPARCFESNGRDWQCDAEFIAHARTDVPRLCAALAVANKTLEYYADGGKASSWLAADVLAEIRKEIGEK